MSEKTRKDGDDETKFEVALEYPLDEPLLAYGEEVKVLKLRKPTGLDVIEIGNPVAFNPFADPVKIDHDMPKVQKMVARLSNTPSSSISKLGPGDLIGLAWAISPFFMPKL